MITLTPILSFFSFQRNQNCKQYVPHIAEGFVGDGKYLRREHAFRILGGDVDSNASHVGITPVHVVEGMVSIDHCLRTSAVDVGHLESAHNHTSVKSRIFEDVPLVELMALDLTGMSGDSYGWRFRSHRASLRM